MNLASLEAKLRYTFTHPELAEEALTHRTWLKEEQDHGRAAHLRDQQRLEFLGDAFLGYVVGQELYVQFPDDEPRDLTEKRSALVKGPALQTIGQNLGLLSLLRLGRGERNNVHANKKILEDTVEALIGAVLLDSDERTARSVVIRLFLTGPMSADADPISEFGKRWQATFSTGAPEPDYAEEGPAHAPTWTATVEVPGVGTFSGEHSSRQDARRIACAKALEAWDAE